MVHPIVGADPPDWFKRKKQVEEKKAIEAERKDQELPVIGIGAEDDIEKSPLSDLTPHVEQEAPETFLLFKRKGFTDSFGLGIGWLSQQDINGLSIASRFSAGWWAYPDLILSPAAEVHLILTSTYLFMLIAVGPQVRWFYKKSLALTGFVSFAFSQGLSRVDESHVPPPPSFQSLGARRGIFGTVQLAYLSWLTQAVAFGPVLNLSIGIQSERTITVIALGLTYQSGKPNYTGDVTLP